MEKIITADLIELALGQKTKVEIIEDMIDLMDQNGRLIDRDEYQKIVMERESLTSTNIGFGISIPHGKSSGVKIPTVAFGKSKKGIVWDDGEGESVNLVFLIAVPEASVSNQHLKILAALSRKLMNEEFRMQLYEANDKESLMEMLDGVLNQMEDI